MPHISMLKKYINTNKNKTNIHQSYDYPLPMNNPWRIRKNDPMNCLVTHVKHNKASHKPWIYFMGHRPTVHPKTDQSNNAEWCIFQSVHYNVSPSFQRLTATHPITLFIPCDLIIICAANIPDVYQWDQWIGVTNTRCVYLSWWNKEILWYQEKQHMCQVTQYLYQCFFV